MISVKCLWYHKLINSRLSQKKKDKNILTLSILDQKMLALSSAEMSVRNQK